MMKIKLYWMTLCMIIFVLGACKKEKGYTESLPDGAVTFDALDQDEVVENAIGIKEAKLLTLEMKATLSGAASSVEHYVTFAPDTTKLANYKLKYGGEALLLPVQNYLYYKPTVAISAGSMSSEAAVINIGAQTSLKARNTYVLPLTIMYVDGQLQDQATRRVVYYVFKTGEALYVDHTGYVVTASASSVAGVNAASRAVDANNTTTFWASALNPAVLPQWIQVDYGRNCSFSGLDLFYPSSVNYATTGGDPSEVMLELSDDGLVWKASGTYPVNVRNVDRKYTIAFAEQQSARYIRVTVLKAAPYISGTIAHQVTLLSGMMLRN